MKRSIGTGILIAVMMLTASAGAVLLKPTTKIADQRNKFVLDAAIPRAFEDWKFDEGASYITVSPDVQAELDKIYNQTLSRTYVNSRGERIMLSIAYGGDQSDSLTVHMPEGCYMGQGFQIKSKKNHEIEIQGSRIPLVRLLAEKGPRVEPITYWIFIGSDFATTRTERKFAQLKSSLYGKIPEGLLVRVSSIGKPVEPEYVLHEQFIRSMVGAMSNDDRKRVIGG
jgi:EpsI family protein